MAKDIFGVLRTIGLIMLISGDVALLTTLYFCQQWQWFVVFTAITGIIGTAEIVCMIIWHKTISTIYKDWIQKDQGKWSWAYTALGCFAFAMSGLVLHLAVFGGMMQKEKPNE